MNIPLFGLLTFAALAAGCAAGAFLVRDLFFSRRKASNAPVRLRRISRTPENDSPSAIGSFDRWFLQLVKETGAGWSVFEAVLLLMFCGMVIGGAIFIYSDHPVLAVLGMVLGMGVALTYLVVRRRKRIRKLQEQFPAALDMLARSMKAGRSIDEAVETAGQQLPEPMAAEFRYCSNQLSLGLALPAVMRSLVDRVRLFDIRIFTTTLTVHRESGGNLAKVLERLAWVVRDRLSYRRQLQSTTGAGRFSSMLIAVIGPVLFVYMFFIHPDYVRAMIESPVGQTLLIAAFVLEVIGIIWTARLLKPTY